MKLFDIVAFGLSLVWSVTASAQKSLTLKDCIILAKENNTAVKIAMQGVETNGEILSQSKKSMLPKVDLIAGYNYLGKPLEVNLQPLKQSIVEGSAQQNLNAANHVYEEITGNTLPSDVQQTILQTSKDIISALYPNYNPQIAKQQYFLSGLFVRQPIYLGGKLQAGKELASQQYQSSKIVVEQAHDLVVYNVTLLYVELQYLNSMIAKQEEQLAALVRNDSYAADLLHSELIPPYQRKWAQIALDQGHTSLENLLMEKQNVLFQVKELMGVNLDEEINIDSKLPEKPGEKLAPALSGATNADIRVLESKRQEASVGVKTAKSSNLPNIYAVGNLQFFRDDLPIVTPPWMVGIELQWTLFDGFERKNKIKMANSLVKEADLLIEQKTKAIDVATRIAANKVRALINQIETLNKTREEAYSTTEMVRKRLENSLSSVKDVNDALEVQYSVEKNYYTILTAYQTAVLTYYYLNGHLEQKINEL